MVMADILDDPAPVTLIRTGKRRLLSMMQYSLLPADEHYMYISRSAFGCKTVLNTSL